MANLINGKSLIRVAGAAHDLIEHLLQAEQVNDPVGAGHIPNLTVLPTSHGFTRCLLSIHSTSTLIPCDDDSKHISFLQVMHYTQCSFMLYIVLKILAYS